jgi:LPS-assembly protein
MGRVAPAARRWAGERGSWTTLTRKGLFAGAALCLIAAAAHGKPLSAMAAPPKPPPAPAPDDGLGADGFYLEADSLLQDQQSHHVTASGEVEARYKGRVIRADTLDYDTQTGQVTATGHVRIVQANGATQFADKITFDKEMGQGFAAGFATRMGQDVKIAAARTERQSADVTVFDKVVYTPCEVCVATHKRPTWSIRARRVVENRARKTLTFQHAVIQVLGVGVLYFPKLPAPDPTADRKSGFLVPQVTVSGIRGFSWEQPYYQVISPSQDITITPQINARVNPFLVTDYRARFYSGLLDIRAGYTYDRNFTSGGDRFGPYSNHAFVLGSGEFNINDVWSWGFTAERTSDPLIFDKYSVSDVFVDRGLYVPDDRRLISQFDAVRQDQNSYLSVAAISIQGLRTTDVQSTMPTVAPLIEGRWEAPDAILGGRLRVVGSAVALTQAQSQANVGVAGQPLEPDVNSRRATVEADWQSSFTFSNGLRVQPFLDARGDLYNVAGTPSPTDGPAATIPRGFGVLGATFSYPLIKQQTGVTYILEPIVQASVANVQKFDPRIPDLDSTDFELDPSNLFEPNRSPGYDIYEGGQAITVGGRGSVILDDGRTANFIFGRRFSAESDPNIPAYSGLQPALSDYVLGADVTPVDGMRLFANLRLNSGDFDVNRLETGVSFKMPRVDGYIAYLKEPVAPNGQPLNSLDLHGETFFTRHWGVTTYAIVDSGAWREQQFGLVYRDECIRVEVIYRHNETFNGTLGPTTSVVVRLSLATIGATR